MTKTNFDHIDLQKIEADARRMRAEAMREMLQGVSGWIRGLFAGHGAHGQA